MSEITKTGGYRYGGRAKGTPNRRSGAAAGIIAAAGFCPITALIDGHKLALTNFVDQLEKLESGKLSPMESEASKYLKQAIDCASQLAGYVYPKLKSIEQVKPNQFDGMTPHEKLEMMKEMVKLLEVEVAKSPNGSGA